MPVWTPAQTKVAKSWHTRVNKWRFVYLDAENRCRWWNNMLQLLLFVLMAMSPVTSFATFMEGVSESTRLTVVGAFSSAVMLLKNVINFYNFDEKKVAFHETAQKFYAVHSKIKDALLSNTQPDWDTFKSEITQSMMNLHSSSPTPPYLLLIRYGLVSFAGNSSDDALGEETNEATSKMNVFQKLYAANPDTIMARNVTETDVFELAAEHQSDEEGTRITVNPNTPPTLNLKLS